MYQVSLQAAISRATAAKIKKKRVLKILSNILSIFYSSSQCKLFLSGIADKKAEMECGKQQQWVKNCKTFLSRHFPSLSSSSSSLQAISQSFIHFVQTEKGSTQVRHKAQGTKQRQVRELTEIKKKFSFL